VAMLDKCIIKTIPFDAESREKQHGDAESCKEQHGEQQDGGLQYLVG